MNSIIQWREKSRQLLALVPFYEADSGGNYTQLLLPGGQETMRLRVKSVKRLLARAFAVDEAAERSHFRELLGREHNLPTVIHTELVLVPVYCRQVRVKDDGAHGYINLTRVEDCLPSVTPGYRARVVFTGGSKLEVMNTPQRVWLALREGEMAWRQFRAARPICADSTCPVQRDGGCARQGWEGPCPWYEFRLRRGEE